MTFKTINTQSRELQMIQDNVASAFDRQGNIITVSFVGGVSTGAQTIARSTGDAPFVDGNLIETRLFAGQDNLLPHGLGYTPNVWVVSRLDTNTNIWEVATTKLASQSVLSNSATDTFLNLWCGTDCNASIWVR